MKLPFFLFFVTFVYGYTNICHPVMVSSILELLDNKERVRMDAKNKQIDLESFCQKYIKSKDKQGKCVSLLFEYHKAFEDPKITLKCLEEDICTKLPFEKELSKGTLLLLSMYRKAALVNSYTLFTKNFEYEDDLEETEDTEDTDETDENEMFLGMDFQIDYSLYSHHPNGKALQALQKSLLSTRKKLRGNYLFRLCDEVHRYYFKKQPLPAYQDLVRRFFLYSRPSPVIFLEMPRKILQRGISGWKDIEHLIVYLLEQASILKSKQVVDSADLHEPLFLLWIILGIQMREQLGNPFIDSIIPELLVTLQSLIEIF